VASSSGGRDKGGEKDDLGRDPARHSTPARERDALVGEENAGPVFNKDDQSHNEPADGSISRNVQRVEASRVECEAGTLHGEVEQPTATQAESKQRKERERKGKRKLVRKRETTYAALGETRATLAGALARVETTGASLDTLDALDAAIVAAKLVVLSCASSELPELFRQAEEKSLHLLREVRAMAKAAEKGDTCYSIYTIYYSYIQIIAKHQGIICIESLCRKKLWTLLRIFVLRVVRNSKPYPLPLLCLYLCCTA
jgi:hypothetical protein